jgi:IMP dehydrogenase
VRAIGIPIVAANMDSVVGADLARILLENGSVPIYHRFSDLDDQRAWVRRFPEQTFVSAGMHQGNEIRELLDLGALGVCIDVAHGHSEQMFRFLESCKRDYPERQFIAGNVCTPMAYHDLVNAGADAVKVGIGPGAACTTRMVTGFGVPQFSAVRECAEIAEKLRVPLIADGGVRGSRDIVLALAAGASSVMIGKLFALTAESAAPKRQLPGGGVEAKYRGQASEDFQNDFYGGLKSMTVAEGTDFWAPVTGPAQALVDDLLGGLRSGMTYGGARTIKELQRKAEFIEVGPGYIDESRPRAS